ncbi:MAG: N-acetylmuramoyl-L-alanine amidase [Lachnospiraceae bacterium]|nr:N-acetylmuramoyl-L-alanine amidase [Lachnospiraceae bacterium]
MTRIETRVITLITVIVTAIAVSGILIIYLMQGTPMLARTRVPDKSGSLIAYIRQQQKNASAYDRLHELELHIPTGHKASDFTIEAKDEYKGYIIHIPGINASYFADYPVSGNGRNISDMTYNVTHKGGSINITTDQPFLIKKSSDGKRVFFDFTAPKEYFDKIVVIDAGHGGRDKGAECEGVYEKDITLAIVKKIKAITGTDAMPELTGYGDGLSVMQIDGVGRVGFFYTRLKDKKMFLKERGAFAKAFDPDLFLSVHINSTSTGRISYINGASVLYRAGDKTGESKKFADLILKNLMKDLKCTSKGTIAGDEMYLIRTSAEPCALAEIGFLTNPDEHKKLISDSYQQKAAQSLVDSIEQYLKRDQDSEDRD